jgi:hypothetical protein
MYRLPLLFLLVMFFAAPAMAQEEEPRTAEEATAEEEAASAIEDVTDEELEELLGLDEDYAESEDEFDPTEEVRVEQSIPFPVDI